MAVTPAPVRVFVLWPLDPSSHFSMRGGRMIFLFLILVYIWVLYISSAEENVLIQVTPLVTGLREYGEGCLRIVHEYVFLGSLIQPLLSQ